MSITVEPMNDSSPKHLTIRASLRTDVGLVRSENQDFGACTTPDEERESHPGGRLLIVADGMGGHRGGATASKLAAETVKAQYLGSETGDVATALHEALTRANARIYSESQSNPDLRGMGTTTSVLAVRGGKAWYAHVGDSRIYLVRNAEIRQLTEDHSLVASMVREGLLSPKEAETHPRRNVLQRSMGVAEEVEIDVRGPFPLEEGDTFILCSDGLHGLVREPELNEVAALPLDEAADEFVKRALERGAPDNVTVIVARVEAAVGEDVSNRPEDPLDDTLRARPSQFDETIPDGEVPLVLDASGGDEPATAPAPAAEPPTPAPASEATKPVSAAAPIAEPKPGVPPRNAGTAATPQTATGSSGSALIKWLLLIALIVGAFGAWMYLR